MRTVVLSALKAGMTRLRLKGGASQESLYDLKNGYVNVAREAVSRDGTRIDSQIPSGTKGLAAFQDKFHVFSNAPVAMTDARYVCDVLIHPSDRTLTIKQIWFSAPFVGALYVSAEFSDGSVYHYWLLASPVWSQLSPYMAGDLVSPSVENGFVYKADRYGAPNPSWKAGVARAVNDVVEPTVYNGFGYKAIATTGTAPKSGDTEPVWPTSEGAEVFEDVSLTPTPPPVTTPNPPGNRTGNDTQDRYGNGFLK